METNNERYRSTLREYDVNEPYGTYAEGGNVNPSKVSEEFDVDFLAKGGKTKGRTVKITERRVYHKIASITMDVPKDIPLDETDEWLWSNEDKWEQALDDKFLAAPLEYGIGLNNPEAKGMSLYVYEDRETRYETDQNYGGHLAKGGWIQEATKEMDKDGTEGAFTKQAKRAGMSTTAFAKKVLKNPNKFTETTRKRAQFMKNTNPDLFAKGGKTSTRAYSMNPSGGMYVDPVVYVGTKLIRTPLHLHKDWNESLGNAKNVKDIEKIIKKDGSKREMEVYEFASEYVKQFAKGGSVKDFEKGKWLQGKQWYISKGYGWVLERYKGDKLIEQYQINVVEGDDYDFIEYSPDGYGDIKIPDNVQLKVIRLLEKVNPKYDFGDEYENQIRQNPYSTMYAKGGKTQGYNARLDESLGMRRGKSSSKKQSKKSRRDESKGAEKASGKRAYSSVDTMDKMFRDFGKYYGNEYDKGGSVKKYNRKKYRK